MGAIGKREVSVNIDPIVREQLVDVRKRRARLTFRHHLGTTGMVGLNDIFRFVCLLQEDKDFLEKFVGSNVLPAAVRPHP